jgi:hypothetical protein
VSDGLRRVLTALAALLYGVFATLAIRSARQAGRVANQWDNRAGDHWRGGKIALVIGIMGMFFTTQQFRRLPLPWRPILFFGFLGGLIYGEWRMGNGFRDVADAQEKWHRRNFGEE